MIHKRKAIRLLLLLVLVTLGAIRMDAQFSGTSYLSAGAGTAIPHSTSRFASPQVLLSLSYGYLLSDKLTIDLPLVYQGLEHVSSLKGKSFSALPTLFYNLKRSDKYRFELGGTLGLGYETFTKPKDPLIEVTGSLNTMSFYAGAALRYQLQLSSKLALFAQYRFLYQPQSSEEMAQMLSAGLCVFI